MKSDTEDRVRAALDQINQLTRTLFIYKPPDDSRNWKPADYIVGWNKGIAFVEVKLCRTAILTIDLRPSQRKAIHDASLIGAPYLLAVWWSQPATWWIFDARRLEDIEAPPGVRVPWKSLLHLGFRAGERILPMVLARGIEGELR